MINFSDCIHQSHRHINTFLGTNLLVLTCFGSVLPVELSAFEDELLDLLSIGKKLCLKHVHLDGVLGLDIYLLLLPLLKCGVDAHGPVPLVDFGVADFATHRAVEDHIEVVGLILELVDLMV